MIQFATLRERVLEARRQGVLAQPRQTHLTADEIAARELRECPSELMAEHAARAAATGQMSEANPSRDDEVLEHEVASDIDVRMQRLRELIEEVEPQMPGQMAREIDANTVDRALADSADVPADWTTAQTQAADEALDEPMDAADAVTQDEADALRDE